jgi:hypothetical protein
MTQTETDFLRQHDWHVIDCQCPVHPCGDRARYEIHVHAIHRCNEPGLLHGDRVELRCRHCVAALWDHVADSLRRVSPYHPHCEGCGAPLAQVPDVIRKIRRLL